jgi:hypothetical protein
VPNGRSLSRKGVPNKVTKALKDMIIGALDQAGGQDYLARQAEESPGAFLTLVGKVLPMQVTGPDDAPLQIVVRYGADQG